MLNIYILQHARVSGVCADGHNVQLLRQLAQHFFIFINDGNCVISAKEGFRHAKSQFAGSYDGYIYHNSFL